MAKDMFGNKITHDIYGNPLKKKNIRQNVGQSQKSIVFDNQNGRCWKCKKLLRLSHTEYHHLKFVSKGGKSKTNNLVALCANCHKEIHKKDAAKNLDKKRKTPTKNNKDSFGISIGMSKNKKSNDWGF
jgi:5-methylcytosine-specific restriction endonuclease McrA